VKLFFYHLAGGWFSCHSDGARDVIWWPNLVIRCLIGYAPVSSSTWCGSCSGQIVAGDHLFLFFSFFYFSWQLRYIIVFFVVWFSISTIILLIFYFVLIRCIDFFFNLAIQLQFLMCFIFHFSHYSFNFSFHFIVLVLILLIYLFFNLFLQLWFLYMMFFNSVILLWIFYFSLGFFVKGFLVFNFIIQIKFMNFFNSNNIYFSLVPFILICFICYFVKVFMIFNFII